MHKVLYEYLLLCRRTGARAEKPLVGTKFPTNSLEDQEVRAYREIERQSMHKVLYEYLLLCRRTGARAEKPLVGTKFPTNSLEDQEVRAYREIERQSMHKAGAEKPLVGTKFPANSSEDQEVRAYREIERQSMHKILYEYLLLCRRTGARAEKQLVGTKFPANSLEDQEVRAYREIERQSMHKVLYEYLLLCRRTGAQAEKPLVGRKFPSNSLEDQEVRAYREIERQSMHKVLYEYLLLCRRTGARAEKPLVGRKFPSNSLEDQEVSGYREIESQSMHKFPANSLEDQEVRGYREFESQSMHKAWTEKPLVGTKFLANSLEDKKVRAYQEIERQSMHKARDEKQYTESDSIKKGIVELISQCGIRKLMMGAAADKDSSKEGNQHRACAQAVSPPSVAPGLSPSGPSSLILQASTSHWRSLSFSVAPISGMKNGDYPRAKSIHGDYSRGNIIHSGSPVIDVLQSLMGSPHWALEDYDRLFRRSPYELSVVSSASCSGENDIVSYSLGLLIDESHRSSLPSVLDVCTNENLYEQPKQTITEATNAKREAFDEAQRRRLAEKDAIDAIRRARVAESLYAVELRQKKELEDALAEEKEKLNDMKNQCEKVMEELRISQMRSSSLENQIAESDQTAKELEQKIISAVDLSTKYKIERDELQRLWKSALREAQELRRALGKNSSTLMPQFFSEFSFSEIKEATKHFDLSRKIGEGGYGSVYRGFLRHTKVAVKMLNSHSLQGPSEFQQEVDVLSKMRHPNLVTLIGACPEAWILVYEYLPNGSLEDRLSCKDNSPPLSWKCRIRIATELCSAIMFLHSGKPHSVIHGDLKPANVLLDSNYGCKLGDFGICSLLAHNNGSSNNVTHIYQTEPKGTFAYMDPEFVSTGELTVKSDVYSFGIILLQLLTGRPALRIAKKVQYALENGNLKTLLDPLAGDWPFVQAKKLARLALRCCDVNRRSRPDLAVDVWSVLEPMKASCGGGGSLSFSLGSDEHSQPPAYFLCPIFQEVMQDPQVAADGFTYEAEALKGWLGSGHDTSPMTNLKLRNSALIPNRSLRSAIQEWLQNR